MPTYRYRCDTCGDEFEVWQSFQDEPLRTHDADGGTVRKVLSAAGIVLKGPGFYRTDSRSNGKRSEAAKDKESSGTKDSKDSKDSSTSTDSKSSDGSSKSSGSGDSSSASTSSSGASKSD
jgi:putative FmdB family regulatory protein